MSSLVHFQSPRTIHSQERVMEFGSVEGESGADDVYHFGDGRVLKGGVD